MSVSYLDTSVVHAVHCLVQSASESIEEYYLEGISLILINY